MTLVARVAQVLVAGLLSGCSVQIPIGSLADASMADASSADAGETLDGDGDDRDSRPPKSHECSKKECGSRCFLCDRDLDPECRRTREGRCDNRERCVPGPVTCAP
jgi:hypothetical protein